MNSASAKNLGGIFCTHSDLWVARSHTCEILAIFVFVVVAEAIVVTVVVAASASLPRQSHASSADTNVCLEPPPGPGTVLTAEYVTVKP